MTDDEFASALEACAIPNEMFRHRDHIRLAWIYLQRYRSKEAEARLTEAICRYAAHHGAAQKYHHTITLAWLLLVEHALRNVPPGATLEEMLRAFPELLSKNTLEQYYSPALLGSESARAIFVEPDLRPLPQ